MSLSWNRQFLLLHLESMPCGQAKRDANHAFDRRCLCLQTAHNESEADHKDSLLSYTWERCSTVQSLDLLSLPAVCLSIDVKLAALHIWATLVQPMLVAMVTCLKCQRRHTLLMVCSYTPDTQEGGGARWLCQCLLSLTHSVSQCVYTHDSWTHWEGTWHSSQLEFQHFVRKNCIYSCIYCHCLVNRLFQIHQQSSCTELRTAAPNSVCALLTLTWEGEHREVEKQERERERGKPVWTKQGVTLLSTRHPLTIVFIGLVCVCVSVLRAQCGRR